jgi:hypothetical protein
VCGARRAGEFRAGVPLANRSSARLFWRVFDDLDYWLTQEGWWRMSCADLSPKPALISVGRAIGGADLAWALREILGWTSHVELICSDLVPRGEVEYLLSRIRDGRLVCNTSKLIRQLPVSPGI